MRTEYNNPVTVSVYRAYRLSYSSIVRCIYNYTYEYMRNAPHRNYVKCAQCMMEKYNIHCTLNLLSSVRHRTHTVDSIHT